MIWILIGAILARVAVGRYLVLAQCPWTSMTVGRMVAGTLVLDDPGLTSACWPVVMERLHRDSRIDGVRIAAELLSQIPNGLVPLDRSIILAVQHPVSVSDTMLDLFPALHLMRLTQQSTLPVSILTRTRKLLLVQCHHLVLTPSSPVPHDLASLMLHQTPITVHKATPVFTSVQNLTIHDTAEAYITDDLLATFGRVSTLTLKASTLSVTSNKAFPLCHTLQMESMRDRHTNDAFRLCPRVQSLYLGKMSTTSVPELQGLQSLSLNQTQTVSLSVLLHQLPNLTLLRLHNERHIVMEPIEHGLQLLDLRQCTGLRLDTPSLVFLRSIPNVELHSLQLHHVDSDAVMDNIEAVAARRVLLSDMKFLALTPNLAALLNGIRYLLLKNTLLVANEDVAHPLNVECVHMIGAVHSRVRTDHKQLDLFRMVRRLVLHGVPHVVFNLQLPHLETLELKDSYRIVIPEVEGSPFPMLQHLKIDRVQQLEVLSMSPLPVIQHLHIVLDEYVRHLDFSQLRRLLPIFTPALTIENARLDNAALHGAAPANVNTLRLIHCHLTNRAVEGLNRCVSELEHVVVGGTEERNMPVLHFGSFGQLGESVEMDYIVQHVDRLAFSDTTQFVSSEVIFNAIGDMVVPLGCLLDILDGVEQLTLSDVGVEAIQGCQDVSHLESLDVSLRGAPFTLSDRLAEVLDHACTMHAMHLVLTAQTRALRSVMNVYVDTITPTRLFCHLLPNLSEITTSAASFNGLMQIQTVPCRQLNLVILDTSDPIQLTDAVVEALPGLRTLIVKSWPSVLHSPPFPAVEQLTIETGSLDHSLGDVARVFPNLNLLSVSWTALDRLLNSRAVLPSVSRVNVVGPSHIVAVSALVHVFPGTDSFLGDTPFRVRLDVWFDATSLSMASGTHAMITFVPLRQSHRRSPQLRDGLLYFD